MQPRRAPSAEEVNQELKRLLVASMGADMAAVCAGLTEERVALLHRISLLESAHAGVQEQSELAAIEADVFKSKFIGAKMLLQQAAASAPSAGPDQQHEQQPRSAQQLVQARAAIQHLLAEHHFLRQSLDGCHALLAATTRAALPVGSGPAARGLVDQPHPSLLQLAGQLEELAGALCSHAVGVDVLGSLASAGAERRAVAPGQRHSDDDDTPAEAFARATLAATGSAAPPRSAVSGPARTSASARSSHARLLVPPSDGDLLPIDLAVTKLPGPKVQYSKLWGCHNCQGRVLEL